ncbi:type IV pilin protein [Photobacterium angustum]|uniref:type IV pilin protein n=1 Tax=Photobacterium angustum TaxID=661 RepID=UPI0005E5A8DF|nr:type IV pilin protein [Photobacterium angustum]KJG17335.1 fimbrial protein [Photobacterium angustum]KJG23719.1 fimbrial protein [Photobacterium angustum]KJG30840.1 fimbrial protein [Photobacterium angustum]PSW94209.1 type IV pilin protein [Photobacterium angustum]PSX02795.1 type IV pilin protein [Photobacterium angustum]
MMTKQKGVTLIELLIVIAIIGVLTAIAYPSYQSYVLKGHRTQAMGDMIKVQLNLEEHFTQNSNYNSPVISGSNCTICNTDSNRYAFSISSATGSYIITATAKSDKGQNQDECGNLTLNQNGTGTPASCW